MKYIKPFSDENLKYDYNRHRYYLTNDVIYKELGINFGLIPAGTDANPSTIAERFIRKSGDDVYRYLYADIFNPGWTEFELACVPELRKVVFEMLLAQAEYNYENGFLETYSGIDIYKSTAMDKEKIRERRISMTVEDIAFQMQSSIGRCLKYAGTYGAAQPSYVDETGEVFFNAENFGNDEADADDHSR